MLKPGTIIVNKYHIEHLIAEGGMAELYLARCLSRDAHTNYVAIKRLLPHFRYIDNHAEYFVKEAHHIINLRSPNIVRGIEVLSDGPELFLIMEFIIGSELGHVSFLLRKESLQIKIHVALVVALFIGRALRCIRHWPDQDGMPLNLVHGDLSAQNILITLDGHVKLVDFGIAVKAQEQAPESELLRGTMRYMSPEQRLGKPLSQASDIYSLALVLEEIIGHESQNNLLYPVLKKAKAQLNKRYQNADEFLEDIEKICLSEGILEPEAFLARVLKEQPKISPKLRFSMLVAELLSFGGALAIIIALVVTSGTRYFYPRIPDVSIDDHHCEDYPETISSAVDL